MSYLMKCQNCQVLGELEEPMPEFQCPVCGGVMLPERTKKPSTNTMSISRAQVEQYKQVKVAKAVDVGFGNIIGSPTGTAVNVPKAAGTVPKKSFSKPGAPTAGAPKKFAASGATAGKKKIHFGAAKAGVHPQTAAPQAAPQQPQVQEPPQQQPPPARQPAAASPQPPRPVQNNMRTVNGTQILPENLYKAAPAVQKTQAMPHIQPPTAPAAHPAVPLTPTVPSAVRPMVNGYQTQTMAQFQAAVPAKPLTASSMGIMQEQERELQRIEQMRTAAEDRMRSFETAKAQAVQEESTLQKTEEEIRIENMKRESERRLQAEREELERQKAELEQLKEYRKQQEEIDQLRRQREEIEKLRKEFEEEENKRLAEERKIREAEDAKRAEEERIENEARMKRETEELERKKAELARIEEERKIQEELERQRREVEEMKRKIEEEEIRKKAEEEARKKAEEEYRKKIEEEARKKVEEEYRRKAEEEARKKLEEELKRKAEEEAKKKAEEDARRKVEEEARKKAAEENARKKAEEDAKRKIEEEAKKKAEAAKPAVAAVVASAPASVVKTDSAPKPLTKKDEPKSTAVVAPEKKEEPKKDSKPLTSAPEVMKPEAAKKRVLVAPEVMKPESGKKEEPKKADEKKDGVKKPAGAAVGGAKKPSVPGAKKPAGAAAAGVKKSGPTPPPRKPYQMTPEQIAEEAKKKKLKKIQLYAYAGISIGFLIILVIMYAVKNSGKGRSSGSRTEIQQPVKLATKYLRKVSDFEAATISADDRFAKAKMSHDFESIRTYMQNYPAKDNDDAAVDKKNMKDHIELLQLFMKKYTHHQDVDYYKKVAALLPKLQAKLKTM